MPSSSWLLIITVCVAVLVAAFLFTQMLFPRFVWRLGRWRYRNPDAVEPSTAMFWLRRIKAGGLLALLIGSGLVLYGAWSDLSQLAG